MITNRLLFWALLFLGLGLYLMSSCTKEPLRANAEPSGNIKDYPNGKLELFDQDFYIESNEITSNETLIFYLKDGGSFALSFPDQKTLCFTSGEFQSADLDFEIQEERKRFYKFLTFEEEPIILYKTLEQIKAKIYFNGSQVGSFNVSFVR